MGLLRDRRGIEGLPLQLLIVAIVAGITAPMVYAGLDAYDRGQVESRVRGELMRLVRAAQQYRIAGGGSETLELDLRGGYFVPVERVLIGDEAGGPFQSAIRYRVGGDERAILAERPSVSMAGPDGKALSLVAGAYAIRLEVLEDRVVVGVV